jgi:hypothetical protein
MHLVTTQQKINYGRLRMRLIGLCVILNRIIKCVRLQCSIGMCRLHAYTSESQKLSALFFFQFIYTKVVVEQVRHFST